MNNLSMLEKANLTKLIKAQRTFECEVKSPELFPFKEKEFCALFIRHRVFDYVFKFITFEGKVMATALLHSRTDKQTLEGGFSLFIGDCEIQFKPIGDPNASVHQ